LQWNAFYECYNLLTDIGGATYLKSGDNAYFALLGYMDTSNISSLTINENTIIIGNDAINSSVLTSLTINNKVRNIGVNGIALNNSSAIITFASLDGQSDLQYVNKNGIRCRQVEFADVNGLILFIDEQKWLNNSIPEEDYWGLHVFSYTDFKRNGNVLSPNDGSDVYLYRDFTNVKVPTDESYFLWDTLSDGTLRICDNYNKSSFPENTIIPCRIQGKLVTSIGCEGFMDSCCNNIKSIILPQSLIKIEDFAFEGCKSLQTINIPYNTTNLSEGFLSICDCNLESISVDNDNTAYQSIDNCLLSKDGTNLIAGCKNSTIPNSVTSIGGWAFNGCSSLTSITIPSGVTSIGYSAFGNCYALAEVYDLSSLNITAGSSGNGRVGQYAKIVRSDSGESYIKDINNIRYYVNGTDNIALCVDNRTTTDISLNSDTTIINQYAFQNCSSLTSITIPSAVRNIGTKAFESCNSLAEVYDLSSLNITVGSSDNGEVGFYAKVVHTNSNDTTNIVLSNNVKYYVNGTTKIALCIYDKTNSSVSLDNDTTEINELAFTFCNELTNILISRNITSIGDNSFDGCDNLNTIIIDSSTIAQDSNFMDKLLVNPKTVTIKILASAVNTSVDTYMITTNGFTKGSNDNGYCVYTKA
jgi:hypothetical protein